MNTEGRDPLFRGLDELAGLSDADHVTDRMAGISRKARANRRRNVAAVGAGLAVIVAAGAVGVLQVRPDGDADSLPATNPPTATDPITDPTTDPTTAPAVDPDGITVELDATQVSPDLIGVVVRIQGTSSEWSVGNRSIGVAGAPYSRVLLDGDDYGFVPGPGELGELGCRAGTPEATSDRTVLGSEGKGVLVEVDGPGTYEVSVRAPYCGADGEEIVAEASRTVTVGDPELLLSGQSEVDVDGDGQDDTVELLMPESDRPQGFSPYLRARVVRASGETTEHLVSGTWLPVVAGQQDLDRDGVPETLIVAEGPDDAWWTVLTFDGDRVVAAPAAGPGESLVLPVSGVIDGGSYQHTFLRDGELVSWFTDGAWDQQSDARVSLRRWVLDDGGTIGLDQTSEPETVCVTADRETWDDPEPC